MGNRRHTGLGAPVAEPSKRRTLTVLVGAAALMTASNSVIFALLPQLQDRFGFSSSGLGIIAAAGFAMSFVVQLVVAPLADRGKPKLLLFGGAFAAVAGNLVCAGSNGLWMLVGARALTGVASGCFVPTARALVSALGEEGRSERLGRMASVEVGGFIVGPVVGGALVGPLGVRWPFVIFCLLAALAVVVVASAPLPSLEARENSGRIAIDLLKQRPMVVAVLISMALGLPIGMYDALWARYLTDLGASPWLVGISLACYSIPFMLFAGVGGRLADRFGPRRTAIRAMILITPLTISYSLFENPWIPILVGICESMIQAAAMPASQSVVANASPPGRAAGGQGLVGATNVATMAVVALVSSWLYGEYGVRTTFVAVACAAALCAVSANLVALPLRHAEATADADESLPLGAPTPAVLESGT